MKHIVNCICLPCVVCQNNGINTDVMCDVVTSITTKFKKDYNYTHINESLFKKDNHVRACTGLADKISSLQQNMTCTAVFNWSAHKNCHSILANLGSNWIQVRKVMSEDQGGRGGGALNSPGPHFSIAHCSTSRTVVSLPEFWTLMKHC